MNKNNILLARLMGCLAGLAGLAGLAACGGSGGADSEVRSIDVTSAAAVFGLLKPVEDSSELKDSLRRGLVGSGYLSNAEVPLIVLAGDADALAAPAEQGFASIDSFSGTNLQERGVDEADIVKYDGETLYILNTQAQQFEPFANGGEPALETSEIGVTPPQSASISLLRTDTSVPEATLLSQISLEQLTYTVDGMYLDQGDQAKQLITIGQNNPYVYWEYFALDYYWTNGQTVVQSWDVTEPESPASGWSVAIDGSLLASRRIENILYLVTRYSPAVEGLVAYPQDEEAVAANKALIEETALHALLPNMTRNGGEAEELLVPGDCYIPNDEFEGLEAPPAGGSLITVTAIDLDAPNSINSSCINASVSGFYASSKSIYLTTNTPQGNTLIHKIALSDASSSYRGSGEVPGYIGTGNPAFLMSELAGDLRVVSSKPDERFFPQLDLTAVKDDGFGRHRLTVLRELAGGSKLQQISQIPNANRPKHIGKPGEDIFAARFMGERAYLVTFELIDPLYVVDTANPADPKIAGELEIPGFSTLLQPLGGNLILGLGYHVLNNGNAITEGVKVALFDVANIAAPISLGEIVVGKRGSSSDALYDHHALTILEVDGAYRAAVPIRRHENASGSSIEDQLDPWFYYDWSDTGLYLFDIDPASGSLQLADTVIVDPRTDNNQNNWGDFKSSRSVLHDEAVFYIKGDAIWAQLWGETESE